MADVIIIGGGTAGLTAAIYIQRSALQCIVLEAEEFGGRIFPTLAIDNYPSMPGVSGADYSEKLREQAESLGAGLSIQTAISLAREGEQWQVKTQDDIFTAPAIIYAAGEKHRLLGIPGEAELFGRGVAICAACDGAFFRDKDVAIVGGGDKALDDALTLSRLCASVHLIHRREEFRAAGSVVAQAKITPNIVMHLNRIPTRILGARRVEGVALRRVESVALRDVNSGVDGSGVNGAGEETLAVTGVFIAVGSIPQTELCADFVQLDGQGYIMAGEDCLTTAPGLFAAGDVRRKPLRQLVTAAADGAVAAKAAADYITHK